MLSVRSEASSLEVRELYVGDNVPDGMAVGGQ